jgi:hypothetical protein
MDITTVMQIIKMIDNQIGSLQTTFDASPKYCNGAVTELWALREHLQEYIEGQVSAMENSTAE